LERLSQPKPPHGNGTVWQIFSLLFHAIDSEKYMVTRYVKLVTQVKLCVYKHDRAKVTQHIQLVSILLHETKLVLGLFCLI